MNDLYEYYSKLNPFNGVGLGIENYCRKSGRFWEYFIPSFINKNNKDAWAKGPWLLKNLKEGVNIQIYFDLVVLGISSVNDRPKCQFCGKECMFLFIRDPKKNRYPGYKTYCKNCRYRHTAELNSIKLKGKPLSEENKKNLSLAKKGKKLTEEQRLKRPRGYHFKLSEEAKEKISKSKKGKIKSRNYYESGKFVSTKFNTEIGYLSSYEKDFLTIIESSHYIVDLSIPDPIKYKIGDKSHYYYPDFLVTTLSGDKFMVEIKAKNLLNTEKVISKRLAGKKWCRKNNVKYITLTEDDLYIKRKFYERRDSKRLNRSLYLYDYYV